MSAEVATYGDDESKKGGSCTGMTMLTLGVFANFHSHTAVRDFVRVVSGGHFVLEGRG